MKNCHFRLEDEVYSLSSKKAKALGYSFNEYVILALKDINKRDISIVSKICTKCGRNLPLEDYSKKSGGKFGKNSICKQCVFDRQHSKEGHIIQMYSSQRKACKLRNYPFPTYTSKELISWCLDQDIYHKLYDQWKDSGYIKDLSPSCDRLDDYKSYSFGNIQIVTWAENLENEWNRRKTGRNNKQSKQVIQLDANGVKIDTFVSSHEAARQTKVNRGNICACCRGSIPTAGGFIWKYK